MGEHHKGCHGITIGKVVAGAAVAVGAVLLAAAVFSNGQVGELGNKVSDFLFKEGVDGQGGGVFTRVGNWLATQFSSTPTAGVEAYETDLADSLKPSFWTSSTTNTLAGVALVGGGAALSGAMQEKAEICQEQAHYADLPGDPVAGGHAERLQMSAIQSLMKGRMIANSPQFMGGAQGVGI